MIRAIRAFFGFLGALFGWLDRKRLLDAGKAQGANEAALEARKRISDALDNPVSPELRQRSFRDG